MSQRGDFWSRRKAQVLEEQEEQARAEATRAAAERDAALEDKTDEEVLRDLGLPDPDTLRPGDDFKAFMAQAVPDRIRRRALRRLWLSNPALANLDGLLDYGEDFTDSATVVENLQTAYQVGKGMLKHVEELARQAEAKEAVAQVEEPESTSQESEADDEVAALEHDVTLEQQELAAPAAYTSDACDAHEAQDVVPRRRMRFVFTANEGAQA